MIQSLLNSRAPIVGLSRAGQRPLVFKLSVIVQSLKGLTVTSERIDGDYLIVTAECLHVKAVRKYYGASRELLGGMRRTLHGWAAGERAKRAYIQTLPLDRKQAARTRKIDALRLKLKRLTRRPHNPATNFYRCHDGYNGSILAWYQQKPLRRSCQSKEALGRYWLTHQDVSVMTKKPWELTYIGDLQPHWGPERYSFLKSEERKTVKAQLAVLLAIPEREVSAFSNR